MRQAEREARHVAVDAVRDIAVETVDARFVAEQTNLGWPVVQIGREAEVAAVFASAAFLQSHQELRVVLVVLPARRAPTAIGQRAGFAGPVAVDDRTQ